jgi:hypothetical protein
MTANATLSSHVNSDVVTRAQLAMLPAPVGTETFRPVPHIELVQTIENVVQERGLSVVEEKLALRRDGAMLFGVLKLRGLDTSDGFGAMGFRTANNKTMSIQIVAGLSVFVCDNLVFRGDLIALKRKHTSGLNLFGEIFSGVRKFIEHYRTLTNEIDGLKQRQLTNVEAKSIMHDVFVQGLMPMRFLPEVSKEYFDPRHAEFEPRTAWSLHNAFTEIAKEMPMTTRFDATEDIGRHFGMTSQLAA